MAGSSEAAAFDFIVVGGGSAGCVIASRLSEDPDCRVLLLEVGPHDRNPMIHYPVGFARMTGGGLTWGYRTAPQRYAMDRQIPFAQAKVIGGGSSINAEVFTRGAPEDYDRWADEEGCPGWSHAELRPYFVRSEDNDTLAGPEHGSGGPLGVSTPSPHRLTRAFLRACQEAGIPPTADFNAGRQAGAAAYQTTTRHNRRCSAVVGYLKPAAGRPNLVVETGVGVSRVVIERGRAVGVELVRQGATTLVHALREVIVTAGAIGSPKLLMLSGVGPADHLRDLDIEVVLDQPAVGQNLQDHYGTDVVYELRGPWSFDKYKKPWWAAAAAIEYHLFGKGPIASNIVEGGAFWWVDRSSPTPDTQLHFLVGAGVEEGVPPVPSGSGVTLNSYCVRPRSRGSVRLSSPDPRAAPVIDPNYLAEPDDLKMSVLGVKLMRDIMTRPTWRDLIAREHLPGDDAIRSDADIAAYVRRQGRTCYHPVGTCRMGMGEGSVVDPQLRVHGIEALRVCDSSIMPSLVSSNTNAPTIMIGEKASDLIRGNRGAPAR